MAVGFIIWLAAVAVEAKAVVRRAVADENEKAWHATEIEKKAVERKATVVTRTATEMETLAEKLAEMVGDGDEATEMERFKVIMKATEMEKKAVASRVTVDANGKTHHKSEGKVAATLDTNGRHSRPVCGRVSSKEPGRWHGNLSLDGSNGQRLTYDLDSCRLHRYTASDAQKCLAGRHLVMVGDSLMRYQYLSLVHFLDFGEYPEPGNPQSRMNEPNLCMEGDYIFKISDTWRQKYGLSATANAWNAFMPAVSQLFAGRERCDCFREDHAKEPVHVENRYYKEPRHNIGVSYFLKRHLPIVGHYPLAKPGVLTESSYHEIGRTPTDWNVSNVEFVQKILPRTEKDQGKVSHVLWNEGIWKQEEDWHPLMRAMREFLKERQGRAFWKGTSRAGFLNRSVLEDELKQEKESRAEQTAEEEGWEMLDAKRLLSKLVVMSDGQPWNWIHSKDKLLETYDGLRKVQYEAIRWDTYHFKPWVYEELNNLWLNMICN